MPMSDARRRANEKWDQANTSRFNCKISRAEGEKFRALLELNGDTVNGVLCAAIRDYIAADTAKEE